MVMSTDGHGMTIAVDLDVKHQPKLMFPFVVRYCISTIFGHFTKTTVKPV